MQKGGSSMIDNIGLRVSNFGIGEYTAAMQKLNIEIPQNASIMTTNWGNMRIKYYPLSEVLTLKNSIHKLYNGFAGSGEFINSNDFTFSNALTTKEMIIDVFERDASDFKIYSTFEWGVNVETKVDPSSIFYRYLSYSAKSISSDFYAVSYGKGKDIQREVGMQEWRIKFYDKSKQEGITNKKIIRYELVVHQLRKLTRILGIKDLSLETVMQIPMWMKLKDELLRVYDSIKKLPLITGKEVISIDDYVKASSFCNSMLNRDIKAIYGGNAGLRFKRECKSIYERLVKSEENLHNLVRCSMEQAFLRLLVQEMSSLHHL